MDRIVIIQKLANKTADYFEDQINEEYISDIVSKKKNKDMSLTKEECVEIVSYSLEAIYGEIIKLIIVLTIASFLGFFLEAVMVTIGFSLLRSVAGGVHMESFERCLIATSTIILGSAYLSTMIHKTIWIMMFLVIISLMITEKYAPLGSEEKPLNTKEEQEMYKCKSVKYIVIFSLISIIAYISGFSNLAYALMFGVITECLTITPVGVRVFSIWENLLSKVMK